VISLDESRLFKVYTSAFTVVKRECLQKTWNEKSAQTGELREINKNKTA
jgi:hypothetical protein